MPLTARQIGQLNAIKSEGTLHSDDAKTTDIRHRFERLESDLSQVASSLIALAFWLEAKYALKSASESIFKQSDERPAAD